MEQTSDNPRRVVIGQETAVQLGIVLALVAGALVTGQNMQRITTIENEIMRLGAGVKLIESDVRIAGIEDARIKSDLSTLKVLVERIDRRMEEWVKPPGTVVR